MISYRLPKRPKSNQLPKHMLREFGIIKLRNPFVISSRFSRAHEAANKFKMSHVDDMDYYAMKVIPDPDAQQLDQKTDSTNNHHQPLVIHENYF